MAEDMRQKDARVKELEQQLDACNQQLLTRDADLKKCREHLEADMEKAYNSLRQKHDKVQTFEAKNLVLIRDRERARKQ